MIQPEFTIRPLTYEAFSGEFRPVSDPVRLHSLGRLVIAAMESGAVTYTDEGDCVDYEAVYRPSWAEEVTVTVESTSFIAGRHRPEFPIVFGSLQLNGPAGSLLIRNDYSGFRGRTESLFISRMLPGTREPVDSFHKLALGTDIHETKLFVTNQAQEYFNP